MRAFVYFRVPSCPKLVRAIIEEEDGGAHTKTKIDTTYRRGTVWYHNVRMGDFKDGLQSGQMELTSNGAKFGEKFKELYNVHSLINFEERMQRVLQELEGRHWVAVAFSKTW